MMISEIFYSIQGEGMLSGVPSVFVRTSGCNLRCDWCDTPYTSWQPEGEDMPLGTILAAVRRHWAGYAVVTGGEPMIAPEIVQLTEGLKRIEQHITVETAGTVFKPVVCDLMSISPKLASSTPSEREGGRWAETHEHRRYQPDVLKQLITQYAYQLKFVVTSPEDVEEARQMVADLDADRERVLLMPEGTDPAVLAERARWLVEVCKTWNFRFSPRLQIELWGNKRGV
ncbi:MAG: 7-carboxy-7-deazaguanine synthase QueE [Acidobacteria bacterium]|nr:7-carboxy-7-deazaguanine synthase QueE [Acidobacteriota bacterium]